MRKTITSLLLILTTSVCTFAGNTTNDSLTVYLQPYGTKPNLYLYGLFKDVAKEAVNAQGFTVTLYSSSFLSTHATTCMTALGFCMVKGASAV